MPVQVFVDYVSQIEHGSNAELRTRAWDTLLRDTGWWCNAAFCFAGIVEFTRISYWSPYSVYMTAFMLKVMTFCWVAASAGFVILDFRTKKAHEQTVETARVELINNIMDQTKRELDRDPEHVHLQGTARMAVLP